MQHLLKKKQLITPYEGTIKSRSGDAAAFAPFIKL